MRISPRALSAVIAALLVGAVVYKKTHPRDDSQPVIVQAVSGNSVVVVHKNDDADALKIALDDLKKRDRRWEDSVALAMRTSRIALAPVVADMQNQSRELEGLSLPKCLSTAKPYLIENRVETVNGFLTFMSGSRADALAAEHAENAVRATRNYQMVIESCSPHN